MTDFVTVDFNYMGKVLSIKLYSKFTCIHGDSGIGKSQFVQTVNDGISVGVCSVTCSSNYTLSILRETDNLLDVVDYSHKIFLVDEISMRQSSVLKTAIKSNHLFICVCRASSIFNFPLWGSYTLARRVNDNWFTLEQDSLPLYSGTESVDCILTESAENRSEHELLNIYFSNITYSNGRDNVEKRLRVIPGSILVMLDLGNISNTYAILKKRCKDNPCIYFYPYVCFEELLYNSPIVQALPYTENFSVFDTLTPERYFEEHLTNRTRGTSLAYKHGKSLAIPFKDTSNLDSVFNSITGKLLLDLIHSSASNYDFDVQEYLHQMLDNKADFLPKAAVAECKTKEDCDNLIESLRNIL